MVEENIEFLGASGEFILNVKHKKSVGYKVQKKHRIRIKPV